MEVGQVIRRKIEKHQRIDGTSLSRSMTVCQIENAMRVKRCDRILFKDRHGCVQLTTVKCNGEKQINLEADAIF